VRQGREKLGKELRAMEKNSLMIIAPYRWGGTWVFDDPVTGLVREPFVAGVPQMIDVLLERKGIKGDQFRLIFSAGPFPGYDQKDRACRDGRRRELLPI
jgi:hypothetical protein